MLNILKDYANKRADLIKLEVTEKSVNLIGGITFLILASFTALFFVILLSFGIGFLIGSYLNNYGYGLLIAAAFYFLVLVFLFINRKTIKNKVANKLLESLDN